MKMKKFTVSALVFVLTVFSALTCFCEAVPNAEITLDAESMFRKISVSGCLTSANIGLDKDYGASVGMPISFVMMTAPCTDGDEYNISYENLSYFKSGTTDENGNFEVVFPLADKNGDYVLQITTRYGVAYREIFSYDNKSVIDLNNVLAEKDSEKLGAFLLSDKKFLDYDTSIYDSLDGEAKILVCRALIDEYEKNGVYENIDAFHQSFNKIAQETRDSLIYLPEFSKESRIGLLTSYYNDSGSDADKKVFAYITENNLLDYVITNLENNKTDDLFGNVADITVKSLWDAQTVYYTTFDKIINTDNVFSFDDELLAKYKSAKNSDALLKEISNTINTASSVDGFKKVIENAVTKINSQSDDEEIIKKPPQSGSKGGGGGGKVSGGIAVIPPVETLPDTDTAQTEPGVTKETFADLDGFDWAKDAILSLKEQGIINGRSEAEFDPSATVTRAEFSHMLAKAMKLDTDNAKSDFADVSENEWFYKSVSALSEKGIVNGMGNGLFGSNNPISRQDSAVMLAGFVNSENTENTDFADADEIADYAKESVKKLKSAKIFSGDENGNFNPKSSITRAESAVVIYNILKGEGASQK